MTVQITIVVALLMVALGFFIHSRPEDFHVQRTAVIAAPAEAVFPLINNFRQWALWSPYEKLDPTMIKTYAGAESGEGAVYTWSGNNKAGEGRMTITSSKSNQSVAFDLEFTRPFSATHQAVFTLTPVAAGTQVSWSMSGKNKFISKAFGLVVNLDDLIGKDFAQGLVNLDAVARGQKKAP